MDKACVPGLIPVFDRWSNMGQTDSSERAFFMRSQVHVEKGLENKAEPVPA